MIRERYKMSSKKYYEKYKHDPEHKEKSLIYAKKYYETHKNDPAYKEKLKIIQKRAYLKAKARYNSDDEYRRKVLHRIEAYRHKKSVKLLNMSDEEFLEYCRRKWDTNTNI